MLKDEGNFVQGRGGMVRKVEKVFETERTEAKAWRGQSPCCIGDSIK